MDCFGDTCSWDSITTLALWTDHWYDIKLVTDGYEEENIPGINLFCFWDSYKR